MKYEAIHQQLEKRGFHRMRRNLLTVRRILAALGNPQEAIAAIHIAGTNGKGSVAATLECVLRKSGYRTGLYISPHLVDVTERIQIQGRPVSKSDFSEIARQVMDAEWETRLSLTYFEFTTVMAFLAFARARCQVVILECGMGGRWDATNIIKDPLLSVITSIGRDHTQWLGNTESKIAAQKAGIIKAGRPVVSGVQGPGQAVLQRVSKRRNSPLYQMGRDFSVERRSTQWQDNRQFFRYREAPYPAEDFVYGLVGEHQSENAGLVISAVQRLRDQGWNIGDGALRSGLRDVYWPGRFQMLYTKGVPVLLDGAHNPPAMQRLKESLLNSSHRFRKIHLVFSAYRDKDILAMSKIIGPLAVKIHLSMLTGERAFPISSLRTIFSKLNRPIGTYQNPPQALESAVREAGKTGLVLVTGSLALVGCLLRELSRNEGDKHHV